MRRWIYKVYLQCKRVFDFIYELTIIHSSKFALLGLFLVSVSFPNLINCVLFLQFLAFSLTKFENVQKYWSILIIYNSLVINAFYGYDVFAPNGIKGIDNNTLDFIGIRDRENSFKKYFPYLILMIVLVISHYVFNSNRYQEFLQQYSFIQSKEYSSQLQKNGKEREKYTLGLSDSVSKFFFKSSIYILIVILFIECCFLPLSLLNLILLIILTVIVHKYFNNQYQLSMYQSMSGTLRVLRVVSVIFILLKYLFQFKDLANNIKMTSEEARKIYESLPLIEKLLGIENSHVGFKLLSLALIIVLTNVQLKFLQHQYLMNIILEEQEPWDRTKFLDPKKNTKCQIYVHHFKMYLLFIIQVIMIPIPILLLMDASYRMQSLMGLMLLFLALLVFKSQYSLLWQNSHSPIGKITTLAMVLAYGFQFLYILNIGDEDILKWIGVKEEKKSNIIFRQLLGFFIILLACILQKLSLKLKSLFTITVSEDKCKSVMEKIQTQEIEDQMTLEEQEIMAVYTFEEPIRACLKFRDRHLKISFFNYGIILMEFMLLTIMMWKQSLISLIYLWFFIVLLSKSYYPKTFEETEIQREKRREVSFLIKKLIAFVTIVMVFEFLMLIDFDIIFDSSDIKQKFVRYLCFVKSEQCYIDWEQWLQISHFQPEFILLDWLLLLSCYLNLPFTLDPIAHDRILRNKYPQINDKQDFYSSQTYSKYQKALNKFIFGGFSYVLIVSILIIASVFHETGMSDLISMIYLFYACYFIVNFRKFYTHSEDFLKNLRKYNNFVLFAILVFQCPVFICPAVSEEKSDIYLNKEECSLYQQINRSKDNYGKQTFMALYIVLTQSLGLFKIRSVQLDLILIIILTEIQCQIFDHPYFQVYVLKHMKLEKERDGKLRAFKFVEETHLQTVWAYQAIKKEIKILHHRLKRIMKTIRNNEISKHLLDESDAESKNQGEISDESALLSEEEEKFTPHSQDQSSDIDQLLEDHKIDIEMFVLQKMYKANEPVISHKQLASKLKNYITQKYPEIKDFDQEQLQDIDEEMEKIFYELQKKSLYKNKIDQYNKEGTGLNIAIQSGAVDYMKDGEFAFYSHLILDSQSQRSKNSSSSQNDEEAVKQIEFEIVEDEKAQEQQMDWYKRVKNGNFLQSVNFYTRMFLWEKFVNKQLFYSLTEGNQHQVTPEKIHFIYLLGNTILSQSENICYLMLFVNFIFNSNLLSLVLPLSACFYGLLDHPVANTKYWKFLMMYILIVIGLKFVYQLPIFCGSPAYFIYGIGECKNTDIIPEELVSRIDYIIGIHKFGGPSSFPKDQGILQGIIGDLLVLIALLLHKNYLIKVGLWHYVKTCNDIQRNPKFKTKQEEVSESERSNMIREQNFQELEERSSTYIEKINRKFKRAYKWSQNFLYKLVPHYLPAKQRNIDIRKQEEEPYTITNPQQLKPGRDYFSQNFFSLLIILVFNIFFYRSVSGEDNGTMPSVNLQRFSIPQVGILFALLAMMMIERMLYRLRNVNSPNSQVQRNVISKHSLTIKLILHVFFVILIHIKLGFYIPKKTNATLSRKGSLIFEYLLWMVYFFYSSLQIRYGYPQGPFKPPFTRDTSFITVQAFRIYKAMPFLWEMKVIVDWTVTSTCLDLFQWFKLDDAFNYLYTNQYQNADRKDRPEYDQRPWTEKFFQGFCFALGLILVILAPILLFSGINPIMVKNPVKTTSLYLQLEMNGNGNTYEILKTQAFNLQPLDQADIDSLSKTFQPINVHYYPDTLQKMIFSPYSENEWSISPPSLQKFIDDFNDFKDDENAFVEIKMNYQLKRDNPIGNELSQYFSYKQMNISEFQPIIDELAQSLKDQNGNKKAEKIQRSIKVPNMFPKMLKLGATSEAKPLEVIPQKELEQYTTINLTLNKEETSGFYWTFKISEKDLQEPFQRTEGDDDEYKDMILIVYNEEVIGSIFGSALQLSVVGLYATIVIAIGRFLRLIFDRMSQRMIYEEMPDTEKLFEICEGIFIAQLEGDLKKEKKLYDLLIRLYRSPETLLKITGTKLHHKQKKSKKKKSSAEIKNENSAE